MPAGQETARVYRVRAGRGRRVVRVSIVRKNARRGGGPAVPTPRKEH
jgi:hypothetical protein